MPVYHGLVIYPAYPDRHLPLVYPGYPVYPYVIGFRRTSPEASYPMRNQPEMSDDDLHDIVTDIVAGLDPEDILAIPGVHDFICKHYADDVESRYADRLELAQEQAAEFMMAAE